MQQCDKIYCQEQLEILSNICVLLPTTGWKRYFPVACLLIYAWLVPLISCQEMGQTLFCVPSPQCKSLTPGVITYYIIYIQHTRFTVSKCYCHPLLQRREPRFSEGEDLIKDAQSQEVKPDEGLGL